MTFRLQTFTCLAAALLLAAIAGCQETLSSNTHLDNNDPESPLIGNSVSPSTSYGATAYQTH
jgi:hypothetical protein